MTGARPSEDDLIARYFAPLAGPGGLGLRDDAALLSLAPDLECVLTVDALVAGVHFFPEDPPASVARKALGVNLSDLAAKGAEPLGFLLSLSLPDDWTPDWLEAFAAGLGRAAGEGGCPLLGGDTVRGRERLSLSVTAVGAVPRGRMVRRTTAEPGDVLCVTGTIGDAALGLALRLAPEAPWAGPLPAEMRRHLLDRYLHPRPRLAAAAALRDHARAAMDVSDGLVGDLAKMMRAGAVSAAVDLDAVPLSPAARAALDADPGLLDTIMAGGDDYEILCAVPPAALDRFRTDAGVPVSSIGRVIEGRGAPSFRFGGAIRSFARGSFSHF